MPSELAAERVVEYLRVRGLLPLGPASVEELGGGVSSRVFLVAAAGRRLVVKQPLPRFRVKDEWLVDTDRVTVEAEFLRLVGSRLPQASVAGFVAFDATDNVLVMTAAPGTFEPWKKRLLAGEADPHLATAAGTLAAKIHRLGIDDPSLRGSFDEPRLFDQQRIDPYIRTLVHRHPARGRVLRELVDHLGRDRTTLIHGDFSPKNMLTEGRTLLLVDHEVATWNDPLFDVAFFLNHLLLKAAHRPQHATRLEGCATGFLEAYRASAPSVARDRLHQPSHLLPALMLARVDGKSPLEYLSEATRADVRKRAGRWLDTGPKTIAEYVSSALSD